MKKSKPLDGHRMKRPPVLNPDTGEVANCECGDGLGDPWATHAEELAWHRKHKAAILATRDNDTTPLPGRVIYGERRAND